MCVELNWNPAVGGMGEMSLFELAVQQTELGL